MFHRKVMLHLPVNQQTVVRAFLYIGTSLEIQRNLLLLFKLLCKALKEFMEAPDKFIRVDHSKL